MLDNKCRKVNPTKVLRSPFKVSPLPDYDMRISMRSVYFNYVVYFYIFTTTSNLFLPILNIFMHIPSYFHVYLYLYLLRFYLYLPRFTYFYLYLLRFFYIYLYLYIFSSIYTYFYLFSTYILTCLGPIPWSILV